MPQAKKKAAKAKPRATKAKPKAAAPQVDRTRTATQPTVQAQTERPTPVVTAATQEPTQALPEPVETEELTDEIALEDEVLRDFENGSFRADHRPTDQTAEEAARQAELQAARDVHNQRTGDASR